MNTILGCKVLSHRSGQAIQFLPIAGTTEPTFLIKSPHQDEVNEFSGHSLRILIRGFCFPASEERSWSDFSATPQVSRPDLEFYHLRVSNLLFIFDRAGRNKILRTLLAEHY